MTDSIIKQSAIEKSFDNLTIVTISFKNLEDNLNQSRSDPAAPQHFKIKEVMKKSHMTQLQNNSNSLAQNPAEKKTGNSLNKRLSNLMQPNEDVLP
jgi:hypothetical protein